MAGKPKKPKNVKRPEKRRKRHAGAWIALGVAVILGGFAGWMHLCARTVHVRYAEVHLADLPVSFDGVKILYVSDFDLCGMNSPRVSADLFRRLQALEPDLLLLGGDYASATLLQALNGQTSEMQTQTRMSFFQGLANFEAPLGKLAISGDHDGNADALRLATMTCGVQLIDGDAAVISNGTDAIAVAGIGDGVDVSSLAGRFGRAQCVIALAHSPQQVVDVRIAEAADGGSWADLVLCGHTHAGQLRIGDRCALTLTEADRRYLYGWYGDHTAPLLVTSGVGCEGVNFRLGTEAEVWLITLHTKEDMA